MTYKRKLKANVVDAIQFNDNREEILDFSKHIDGNGATMNLIWGGVEVPIRDGDYVLRDSTTGEYHVCAAKEFEAAYEQEKPLILATCNYREFIRVLNSLPALPFQFRLMIQLSKPQYLLIKYELEEFSEIKIQDCHEKMMKIDYNQNKYTIIYD